MENRAEVPVVRMISTGELLVSKPRSVVIGVVMGAVTGMP